MAAMPEFAVEFPVLYWDQEKRKKVLDAAFADATKQWLLTPFRTMIEKRMAVPAAFLRNHHLPYFAPDFSAQIIGRLLLEQCLNNTEEVRRLVQEVVNVMDKVSPKINTFLIIGPPSSGKTYFVKTLLSLSWKYGQIRNNKKGGDSFTFQDGIGTRVNEWNECLLMGKEEVETCKMVWEGATTPVNVKYKTGQRLQRTPLFITCNNTPWRMCQNESRAFKDRCYEHHWSRQEWLKEMTMYPHPLLWLHLLNHIDDDNWLLELPTTEELVLAVKDNVDPNIFFDIWIQKNCKEEEYQELLKDCVLYDRSI